MFYFERFRLNVKISVYSIFIWILNNERSKKLVCSNHCASLSLASIHLQIEAWSSAFFHSLRPFLQKHSIIINTAENTPSQEKQSQWSLKVKKKKKIMCSKIQHRKSDDRFWQETSLFFVYFNEASMISSMCCCCHQAGQKKYYNLTGSLTSRGKPQDWC